MRPRVSIMMPAYNAAQTLPLALASVAAQTYADWECLVVDDGSHDATAEVVTEANDERIKLIRLPENRGRPFARKSALEAAQGSYLCMLDADDWMYPQRLALQVEVLDHEPEAALVSAGMAVVAVDNVLVGARAFGQGTTIGLSAPFSGPDLPPVAHAPSMLRRDAIGDHRHDPRLKLSQDVDFLMQVLRGKRYYLMPELLYVYTELQSVTAEKILAAHHYTRLIYAKHFHAHPLRARKNWLVSLAKSATYAALFKLGQEARIIRARSSAPSPAQAREFVAARAEVERWLERMPCQQVAQKTTTSPSGKRVEVRSPT
jgi:glycosyltransferase involved in cell wall biosynthesis